MHCGFGSHCTKIFRGVGRMEYLPCLIRPETQYAGKIWEFCTMDASDYDRFQAGLSHGVPPGLEEIVEASHEQQSTECSKEKLRVLEQSFLMSIRHRAHPAASKSAAGIHVAGTNYAPSHSLHGDTPILKSKALTILVIDDQSTGRLLITEILKGVDPAADIIAFGDPFAALAYAGKNRVDLVLTDYSMPMLDGIETIKRLREMKHMAEVPIVCVTVMNDREVKYRALDAGATDFLKRPLDPLECAARCRNLLDLRRHQLLNHNYTEQLEFRVAQVTQELRVGEMEMLLRLAGAAEHRDSVTGRHLTRMAKYSALLAREYGWNEDEQHMLELAAPLHDIGKIGIPDTILQAKRRLTDEEMIVMRTHAHIGFSMLRGSPSRYLGMAASVAYAHHEKFDGSGYPRGLAGENIPLEARIVAIADVYDALTTIRPYKQAWTAEETTKHMLEQRGKHFDPLLLDKFLACSDETSRIRQAFDDSNCSSD